MKLLMAGGGTGGHLFPIIALADEFRRRVKGVEIVFVGGRGGLEESVVPRHGYELRLLNVSGLKRKKGLEFVKALARAAGSTARAVALLRKERPHGVIGSGSYSSGPVVLAAAMLGIKTAILEQNAVPGLTNRLLGRFADRIYIAFDEAARSFPRERTRLTGNPVRREVLESMGKRVDVRGERFTLLVFGGSQGATSINAAFLDATEYLTDIWSRLRVVHQTGSEGYEAAAAAYRRKGLKVELHRFIEDMGEAYASADLVVCRAGATSIAEIMALGLPSILVPYPFASDEHQEVNARYLESRGAAVMLRNDELTGSTLAAAIRRFYADPVELRQVRHRVRELARPAASVAIVDDYMKMFMSNGL
ncbi:MAG TPA: undecaprenyldiphospho-muramoylpentapeptide beta-N-acetylglucosaminyltransferase [Deltaproteobacteria bacterium]|nr:undecaprenyldiphospho-muramoylpentapeptide beta-N-acetylglucosaminyltransferase [Deltaproteobacteria bacterium]